MLPMSMIVRRDRARPIVFNVNVRQKNYCRACVWALTNSVDTQANSRTKSRFLHCRIEIDGMRRWYSRHVRAQLCAAGPSGLYTRWPVVADGQQPVRPVASQDRCETEILPAAAPEIEGVELARNGRAGGTLSDGVLKRTRAGAKVRIVNPPTFRTARTPRRSATNLTTWVRSA